MDGLLDHFIQVSEDLRRNVDWRLDNCHLQTESKTMNVTDQRKRRAWLRRCCSRHMSGQKPFSRFQPPRRSHSIKLTCLGKLQRNRPIRLTQCCTKFKSFGNKPFCSKYFHIQSFKCECYIIMQMKHSKNLNPERPELGTTLSSPNWSMAS